MYKQDIYDLWTPFPNRLKPYFLSAPKTFKNEYEAFQYCWDRTRTMETIPQLWTKLKKKKKRAEDIKDFADGCYKSKEYERAEVYYYDALAHANCNGITYKKILSNIALLRYAQGKYNQCIELINICEKRNYLNLFPQLLITKMKALKKFGDDQKVMETFRQLKELLDRPSNEFVRWEQKEILDEANKVLKELENKKIQKKCKEEPVVPKMEGTLTSKAEIRSGGVRGTIIQATENIKRGEPILVEPMYCPNMLNFCSYCCSPNELPHPCKLCTVVMYCSENCKKADIELHKLQCTLYQMYSFREVSPFMLMPFILLMKGRSLNGFQNFKAFSENKYTLQNTLFGCWIVVSHIMENKEILKTLVDKNIIRSGLDARETACEIGKKLLELAVILKFNNKPWDKWWFDSYIFFQQFMSFEHSCAPNTSQYLSGNKIVVKAAEDILAGQEITVAYEKYLLYSYKDRVARQEQLQKFYGFKCQCRACQNVCLEAAITGVIKCERCDFYMRYEYEEMSFNLKPIGFVCENCSNTKGLNSAMLQEIAHSLHYYINDFHSVGKQQLERLKELKINPFNETVVRLQLLVAWKEMRRGNVEYAMEIIFTSGAIKGSFRTFNNGKLQMIFELLQNRLKFSLLRTIGTVRHCITEEINTERANLFEKFLIEFESMINLYNPKRQILEEIDKARKYLSIIKQIIYGEKDKVEWNIDKDELRRKNLMHETIQEPFY